MTSGTWPPASWHRMHNGRARSYAGISTCAACHGTSCDLGRSGFSTDPAYSGATTASGRRAVAGEGILAGNGCRGRRGGDSGGWSSVGWSRNSKKTVASTARVAATRLARGPSCQTVAATLAIVYDYHIGEHMAGIGASLAQTGGSSRAGRGAFRLVLNQSRSVVAPCPGRVITHHLVRIRLATVCAIIRHHPHGERQ
jgi:hypothetical protein